MLITGSLYKHELNRECAAERSLQRRMAFGSKERRGFGDLGSSTMTCSVFGISSSSIKLDSIVSSAGNASSWNESTSGFFIYSFRKPRRLLEPMDGLIMSDPSLI